MIAQCNAVLGMEEFDEDVFSANVEKIIVTPEKLTFRLTDGKEIDTPIYVKEDSKTRKPPTQFSQWTGKIRCEVCGKNYVRQTRHYLNGDTEHYWICGTGKTCEGRKNGILWQNDIDEGIGNSADGIGQDIDRSFQGRNGENYRME